MCSLPTTQEKTLHMASPDGQHWNQIDYILCSQKWRSSIQSAKTRQGADCGSNHELFALGGQNIGASTSASVLPVNIRTDFLLDWLVWSPCCPGTLKSLIQQHNSKISFLRFSACFMVQLSHTYITTGKTTALTIWTFFCKVMSLLFNMLPSFSIAFLPKSVHAC